MISDQNLGVSQLCDVFILNALREFYCQMKVSNTGKALMQSHVLIKRYRDRKFNFSQSLSSGKC